jgi:hypothetical protein
MDHEKIILFNFEQGSKRGPNFEILHIWKVYLTLFNTNSKTRQKSKIQFVQLITLSNTLCQVQNTICTAYYSVQHIVSSPKYNLYSLLLCPTHCVKQTLAFDVHFFNFPSSTSCSHIMLHSV